MFAPNAEAECVCSPLRPAANRARRPFTLGRPPASLQRVGGALVCVLAVSAVAQDALLLSLSNQGSAAQRRINQENIPYTVRWGDLKMRTSGTFGLEFNDNVNLAYTNSQSDLILRPMVNEALYWPVTDLNLLTFSMGLGYQKFLQHNQYDQLLITPDSALGWDIFLTDWQINLHDQFSYQQDPTTFGAVSGSATFGGFYNTVGALATWDLHDVTLSFGFDHFNFDASSGIYSYLSRGSDFGLFRAGFQVHETATIGAEISGGPTYYTLTNLSGNTSYSFGLYGNWRVTESISLQPRGGYYIYSFADAASSGGVTEQTGYYGSLTLNHQIRRRLGYKIEAGVQAYMGNYSALTELTYIEPSLGWQLREHLFLNTSFRYESARQPIIYQYTTAYERISAQVALSYQIRERWKATLTYRYLQKTVDTQVFSFLNYSQNRLTVELAYNF